MEDTGIIRLFFERNEEALKNTRTKYGYLIKTITLNITGNKSDAEECENDTYLKLWNTIPPENPVYFKAYIGRLARNAALSRYRFNKASKRDTGLYVLLSELEECIPSESNAETEFDGKYVSTVISDWLKTLEKENRVLFIKRYWYGESIKDLAELKGVSPARLSSLMFSLRKQLKEELTRKGVDI